jgi:hypothetical protein
MICRIPADFEKLIRIGSHGRVGEEVKFEIEIILKESRFVLHVE